MLSIIAIINKVSNYDNKSKKIKLTLSYNVNR